MTQQTSVTLGGGAGGSIREDLANYVSNIDRDETPFISSIGRGKATSTTHAWLTDVYADPAAQSVAEGAAFNQVGVDNDPATGTVAAGTLSSQTNRVRLDNETQIFRAQIEVSNTAVAVNTAGIANEFAYQLKKKGVEVRRNVEFQATRYNATGSTKASGVTRRMGSLFSYLYEDNLVDNQATPGTFTYATPGTGVSVPAVSGGTGGARAIQRSAIESLTTNMYGNGGRPNIIMMSHFLKPSFSTLFNANNTTATFSERRLSAMEKKLNIAITGVMTDFGFDIALVPNYVMAGNGATSHALAYDSRMLKSAVLRPLNPGKLNDYGDGKLGLVTEECTLEVMNPRACGAIFSLSA